MRTYFFMTRPVNGHNKKFFKMVTVYRNVQNKPKLVGSKEVDTRSFAGDRFEAKKIIHEIDKQTIATTITDKETFELFEVGC